MAESIEEARLLRSQVSEVLAGSLFVAGGGVEAAVAAAVRATHVVHVKRGSSLAKPCACSFHDACAAETQVQHLYLSIGDVRYENIAQYFEPVCSFIDHALRGDGASHERVVVVIHSEWGLSRAPTLAIAYLVHASHFGSVADALARLRATRSALVRPNVGFVSQLLAWHPDADAAAFERSYREWYREAHAPSLAAARRLISDLEDSQGAVRNGEKRLVCAGTHWMRIERVLDDPRVARVANFVSHFEAEYLIELAKRSGLHRSRTAAAGGISATRTSSSCRLPRKDAIVSGVADRAAFLVGMPVQHTEALQCVHYDRTQHYDTHYDWFQDGESRSPERELGSEQRPCSTAASGQRIVSVFVYLADCHGGGHTHFPVLERRFAPTKGHALVWFNRARHQQPPDMDRRVLHAGEPVLAGEKWGMNIWFRERPVVPQQQQQQLS